MKLRGIVFWHGSSPAFRDTLLKVPGVTVAPDRELVYEGTLDAFEKNYGKHFMVLQGGNIAVTPYNSFGPR